MTVEFKVGDKVRITARLSRAGQVGTIISVLSTGGFRLEFDDGDMLWYGRNEVEKVDDVIWKKGTKVKVTVEATVEHDSKNNFISLRGDENTWLGGVEINHDCVTVEEVKPTTAEILEKLPVGARFKTEYFTYIKINDAGFIGTDTGLDFLPVYRPDDFDTHTTIEVL